MNKINYGELDFPVASKGLLAKIDLKSNSRPYDKDCCLRSTNDIDVILEWLEQYKSNSNTYAVYKRESLRFLTWCTCVIGKAIGSLDKQDFEDYFLFMQNPATPWNNQSPFTGRLSQSAVLAAARVLNSLLNYLVDANYLRANPIKLIKKYSKLPVDFVEQKYKVWERILDIEEWQAVQQALSNMPESSKQELDNKVRTQFLFALLYFLGLRINEVASHTWASFRKKNGKLWFFVNGKGNKKGHVPVNEQLLSYIKSYRTYLGKSMELNGTDHDSLIISQKTKRSLRLTQLYKLVKHIGSEAAKFFPEDINKQNKLKSLSPHWLRHLSASHQDLLGIPLTVIKNNLRHQSIQTTQIYIHGEDDSRFNEIQKMQMKTEPFCMQPLEILGYEFKIALTKGPINKSIGIIRLIDALENLVFKNITWMWIGGNKQDFIDNIDKQGVYCKKIEICYQLESKEVIDNPNIWIEAIKRQGEIWMFNSEIVLNKIEKRIK